MTVEELKIKISADISGLTTGVSSAKAQINGLSADASRSATGLNALATSSGKTNKAFNAIANAINSVRTGFAGTIGSIAGVNTAFTKSSAATTAATTGLKANAATTGTITNGYQLIVKAINESTATFKQHISALQEVTKQQTQFYLAHYMTKEALDKGKAAELEYQNALQSRINLMNRLRGADTVKNTTEIALGSAEAGNAIAGMAAAEEGAAVASTGLASAVGGVGAAIGTVLGVVLPLVIAFGALRRVGSACSEALNIQKEAEVKLSTIMKTRMAATGKQIQSVKNYASALQGLGVIGDEVALAGAQQVSTYLEQAQSIQTLLPAMENLAAQMYGVKATAENMTSIGNMFGKAIATDSLTQLIKAGILFTDSEKREWQTLQTEEQKAAFLAQVVQENVGNMNSALAATYSGQVKQLANNFGDLKEQLGVGFQTALLPIIKLINIIIGGLATAFKFVNIFLGALFGKKIGANISATGAGVSSIADDAENFAGSTGKAAKNTGTAAKNAKKIAKTFRGLVGIDEINNLAKQESGGSGSGGTGGGGGAGGIGGSGLDFSSLGGDSKFQQFIDKVRQKAEALAKRVRELYKNFVEWFKAQPLYKAFATGIKLIQTGFKDLISGIKYMLSGAFDVLKGVGNVIVGFFTGDTKRISKGVKQICDGVTKIIFGLIKSLGGILKSLGGIVLAVGAGILNIVAGLVKGALKSIKAGFKAIIKLLTPLALAFAKKFKAIVKTIKNSFKKIGNHFKSVGKSILDGITKGLGNIKTFVKEKIAQPLQKAWENLKTTFSLTITAIKDEVFDTVASAWESFTDKTAQLTAKVNEAKEGAIAALHTAWETVQDRSATLLAEAKEKVAGAISRLKDGWETVQDRGATLIAEAKEKVSGAIASLKNNWETIKDRGATLTAEAKEKVAGAIGKIKSAWDAISNKTPVLTATAKNASEAIFTTLKSAWGSIYNKKAKLSAYAANKNSKTLAKIKKAWNFISSKKATLSVYFNNSFTKPIKSAWNSIASTINGAIGTINKLPGVNISSRLPLLKLAKGGVTTGSTIANIGERGREAVLPLERNTGWMDTLSTQLVSKMGVANSNQPINITLNVGGTKFGKACIKSINEAQKQSGAILLNI